MKMRNALLENRFLATVSALSILWALIYLLFVSVFVGWGNLFDFLFYEIAVIFLSFVAPVLILVAIWINFVTAWDNQSIAEEIRSRGELIGDLSKKIDQIAALTIDMGQGREVFRRGRQEKETQDDSGEIGRQAALLGLLNAVLTDISLSSTRIFVRLAEMEGRSREEIKFQIQGLMGAYSAGDKEVFIRALHQGLAKNPEGIDFLRSHAGPSSGVSRDVSKVLRETGEIESIIARGEKGGIVESLFEDNAMRSLKEVLEPHFNLDGTAKPPAAPPE